eukprot:scaffold732_cov60-Phaeocystis_antarctica.AAC.11
MERCGLHQVRRLQLVTQYITRRVRLGLGLGTHRRELLLQRRLVRAAQPPRCLLQTLARLRARRIHRRRTLLCLALFGLARLAPRRLTHLVPRGAHRGLAAERRLLRRGGPLQRSLLFDGRAQQAQRLRLMLCCRRRLLTRLLPPALQGLLPLCPQRRQRFIRLSRLRHRSCRSLHRRVTCRRVGLC